MNNKLHQLALKAQYSRASQEASLKQTSGVLFFFAGVRISHLHKQPMCTPATNPDPDHKGLRTRKAQGPDTGLHHGLLCNENC